MRVTVSRPDMFQAVQRCQNIVERRHTVPILSNILLQAEDGKLTVTATDLDIGLRTGTAADVEQPGKTTVSARKLFDILRELDADVEMQLDQGFLHIKSGHSKFRLLTMSADEYPQIKEEKNSIEIQLDGSDLAAMIAATSFAMSTDETRKYLTGTLFEIDESGSLNLVATDGHRLAMTQTHLSQVEGTNRSIVPRKAVVEIRKLCEEIPGRVTLGLGERQVRLDLDAHTLVSKLIDARFPNYADVIPVDNPEVAVVSRNGLDQVLRRVMIVANEFTHDVRLKLQADEMLVTAHNTEQEQAEESLSVDYSGQEMEIGFNARYIRDVLGAMHEDQVRIFLRDSLSPVLMKEETESTASYVIMPMRI